MQFEEFDDKVKQAADHHHPPYDEQAWTKMEKLLDKHLPQEEKKKRRFIFFLLFFLLLGGGAWLFVSKPWEKETATTGSVATNNNDQTTVAETTSSNEKVNISQPQKENATANDDDMQGNYRENKQTEPLQVTSLDARSKQRQSFTKPATEPKKDKPAFIAGKQTKKQVDNKDLKAIWGKGNGEMTDVSKTTAIQDVNKTTAVSDPTADKSNSRTAVPVQDNKEPIVGASDNKASGTVSKTEAETISAAKPGDKKGKEKKQGKNSFFFALSAGPDISFVSAGKLGTTKLLTGLGLGYTFNNKLSIRTGFYSGRKIYSASRDAYNPPASFWTYYPYLEKVDADCKVYEIPLSFSYHFGNSPKQNWFASAGVSSLLMKKETYNYFYKYAPYAPTVSKKWTIENENKHYFSVLTLSGGYQRKIGNNVSIMAEPYVKLPLSGVGYGKVKLNSGGVLFTVTVNPFSKSKPPVIKQD